jgi:hypothetical protein
MYVQALTNKKPVIGLQTRKGRPVLGVLVEPLHFRKLDLSFYKKEDGFARLAFIGLIHT